MSNPTPSSIHPQMHSVEFRCRCGFSKIIQSALSAATYDMDVCSKCHPFHTGKKQNNLSSKVLRYQQKYGAEILGIREENQKG